MPSPENTPVEIQSDAFLAQLMREQFKLSMVCAVAFMVALLALPLCNYFLPEFMSQRIGGFTISWLILGVLFFPYVWLVAYFFIKKSIAMENEEADRVLAGRSRINRTNQGNSTSEK